MNKNAPGRPHTFAGCWLNKLVKDNPFREGSARFDFFDRMTARVPYDGLMAQNYAPSSATVRACVEAGYVAATDWPATKDEIQILMEAKILPCAGVVSSTNLEKAKAKLAKKGGKK